jgi:hypothetical protein
VALPLLEVIDQGRQLAPSLTLLSGNLRPSPLYEFIDVGVIAPKIVNGIEKRTTMGVYALLYCPS